MNTVCLIGRLTKEVETRYTTTSNIQVSSFTLAVNKRFAKENEQQADFINIIAWGKTAEFCSKYFVKGQQVAIRGRINTRDYTDKGGKKIYVTEVIAEDVYFADSKREQAPNTAQGIPTSSTFQTIEEDQNLPF
jgi:single-strand DNA-binding protein